VIKFVSTDIAKSASSELTTRRPCVALCIVRGDGITISIWKDVSYRYVFSLAKSFTVMILSILALSVPDAGGGAPYIRGGLVRFFLWPRVLRDGPVEGLLRMIVLVWVSGLSIAPGSLHVPSILAM
jgi:hypothetical protein